MLAIGAVPGDGLGGVAAGLLAGAGEERVGDGGVEQDLRVFVFRMTGADCRRSVKISRLWPSERMLLWWW
jgi:hypothetical protein